MGESLPLPVARPVSEAHSDAEPGRIAAAVVGARLGLVMDAVSVAVVARLSGATLGAVEKALSGAVLDAVVVRVLGLVSARVSVADVRLRLGMREGTYAETPEGDGPRLREDAKPNRGQWGC